MKPICFLDTETDGVHHGRQPWEVALIRADDDGRRQLTFMLDIDLSVADPFGLAVGRYYERHPMGMHLSQRTAPDPEKIGARYPTGDASPILLDRRTAAKHIARYTHDATIVGLVPSFDTEVCAELLRAERLRPGWHYHLQDVESIALGSLAYRGRLPADGPPWKSDELSELFGVTLPSDEERHTALGDALWAERWWRSLDMPYPQAARTDGASS